MPHSRPSNCLRSTPLSQRSWKSHRWERELLYFSREFQLILNSGKGEANRCEHKSNWSVSPTYVKKQFHVINYQKIQISTTIKPHYSLIRMARMKRLAIPSASEETEPLKFSGICHSYLKKYWQHHPSQHPWTPFPGDFLGVYPRKSSPMFTEIVSPEFHGSFIVMGTNWKLPKRPSIGDYE